MSKPTMSDQQRWGPPPGPPVGDSQRWAPQQWPQPQPWIPSPPLRDPGWSRRKKWAVAAALTFMLVAALGAVAALQRSANRLHDVRYLVTGNTATANITYTNSDGTIAQQSGIDVPAVNKVTGQPGIAVSFKSGQYFSISAQDAGRSGGSHSISCTVEEDGHNIMTHTSYGAYAIVDCNGDLP